MNYLHTLQVKCSFSPSSIPKCSHQDLVIHCFHQIVPELLRMAVKATLTHSPSLKRKLANNFHKFQRIMHLGWLTVNSAASPSLQSHKSTFFLWSILSTKDPLGVDICSRNLIKSRTVIKFFALSRMSQIVAAVTMNPNLSSIKFNTSAFRRSACITFDLWVLCTKSQHFPFT